MGTGSSKDCVPATFTKPLSQWALVPEAEEREQVLRIAARIMDAPGFIAVQTALRTRLQFTDRIERGAIARVAADALEVPLDASPRRTVRPRRRSLMSAHQSRSASRSLPTSTARRYLSSSASGRSPVVVRNREAKHPEKTSDLGRAPCASVRYP